MFLDEQHHPLSYDHPAACSGFRAKLQSASSPGSNLTVPGASLSLAPIGVSLAVFWLAVRDEGWSPQQCCGVSTDAAVEPLQISARFWGMSRTSKKKEHRPSAPFGSLI